MTPASGCVCRCNRFSGFLIRVVAGGLALCASAAFAQPYVHDQTIGRDGPGPGQFGFAVTDVAIDPQGRIIAVDSSSHAYEVCDFDGECEEFGGNGDGLGQFFNPSSVDVNSDGDILIVDAGNRRVQRCDYDGNCELFEADFDDGGLQWFPMGVAVDSQDRVIISDGWHRIIVCPPAGGDCDVFGEGGLAEGQFSSPKAVAIDANDQIVVADTYLTVAHLNAP